MLWPSITIATQSSNTVGIMAGVSLLTTVSGTGATATVSFTAVMVRTTVSAGIETAPKDVSGLS